MTPVAQEVSCTNRISVFSWPSIERVHVRSAWPAPSIATCWKSSNSRSSEQSVPPVQIGPVLTTVGSTVAGAEKVAPPSVLSRYCSNHWPPLASTHGYTEVPPDTIVLAALQLVPQLVEVLMRTRVVLFTTSCQTATSLLPPALATTGKLVLVSAPFVVEMVVRVNVLAPFVDLAKLTPPL